MFNPRGRTAQAVGEHDERVRRGQRTIRAGGRQARRACAARPAQNGALSLGCSNPMHVTSVLAPQAVGEHDERVRRGQRTMLPFN